MKKFRSAQQALGEACVAGNADLAKAAIDAGALPHMRSFKSDGTVVRNSHDGRLGDRDLSAEQLAETRGFLGVLAVLPGYNMKSFVQAELGKASARGDTAAAQSALHFGADPNLPWYGIEGRLDGVETPSIVASRSLSFNAAYGILRLLLSTPGVDKKGVNQVLLGLAVKAGDSRLCRRAISGGALIDLGVYSINGFMTCDKSQGARVYHSIAALRLATLAGHDPDVLLAEPRPPRFPRSTFFTESPVETPVKHLQQAPTALAAGTTYELTTPHMMTFGFEDESQVDNAQEDYRTSDMLSTVSPPVARRTPSPVWHQMLRDAVEQAELNYDSTDTQKDEHPTTLRKSGTMGPPLLASERRFRSVKY